MESAFGVDHGEFSKAGPFGAGMQKLGGLAARRGGAANTAMASGRKARVGHINNGFSTGSQSLENVQHTNVTGGKFTRMLGQKSKNFRQGFVNQTSSSFGRGQNQVQHRLPGFLR